MFEAATLALLIAAQPAPADEPEPVCVAIVGDDEDHVDNAEERQARIASILQSSDHVTVIAFEHLDEPEPINLRGIQIVSADIDSGVAKIRIEDDAGLPCVGEYELLVDDSLGRDLAVRAVLDDAILLARNGELLYVPAEDEMRLDWSMVWRSRFAVLPNNGAAKKAHVRSRAKATRKPTKRR